MKLDSKTAARLALPAGKTDAIYFCDDLPGFGLRLRSSGDRVRRQWIVQYRHGGATRRLLLGPADVLGIEQARAAAKKALAKVHLGEDPQAQKATRRAADKFALRDLAEQYLAAKDGTVRARTLTETRRFLQGGYFAPLQRMPVDQIARRDIAARLLIIARENGAVSAARARSSLSAMFTWGMGQGLVEANPVVGTTQPKAPPSRDRVLSDDELAAIWRAASDDDFGRIVKLLVLTGQRRSEVGGMSWGEVDTERGTWTIPSARTKNGRTHAVVLSALALSVIDAVPEIVGRDYLFGPRAAGFTSWNRPKQFLDKRLGDQVASWTLHDIRRSVATRMCDLGILPHVVEQVLNHHSGHRRGPAGVYNRSPYEREVRAAMALWSDHLRTLIEGGERKVLTFPADAS